MVEKQNVSTTPMEKKSPNIGQILSQQKITKEKLEDLNTCDTNT